MDYGAILRLGVPYWQGKGTVRRRLPRVTRVGMGEAVYVERCVLYCCLEREAWRDQAAIGVTILFCLFFFRFPVFFVAAGGGGRRGHDGRGLRGPGRALSISACLERTA